ncbi:MAG TPA: exosortase/archaeosortase family protein [Myxococcota bacterium]|nr:exosortase/archaeosortase family protein [Myxococcales bacterium]HPG26357.1 exosortase/archaeosortase family protein [Myxococcota bacterium]
MTHAPQNELLASSDVETSPIDRRTQVGTVCVLIVVLFGIYFPILREMVHHWSVVEDYQHGFLVVPLALFFAYERRWDLEDARIHGSWLGLIPLVMGVASLAIGRLGTELMTMRLGFVLTLIGLVLLLLGREIFRILAFPLFFLFLMVPLPQSLVNTIAFPLQLVAAKFAVFSLQELGIPALVEGNIIHLAHTELFVHEACSGLRSLMALVTLGVVFAHFFKPGVLWMQLVLVASTIPIAIAVNAFRVALTGFLAHHFGEEAAGGVIHDFQGIFTFALALAMLLAEGRLLDILSGRIRTPDDATTTTELD